LESLLKIERRWVNGSEEWQKAYLMVQETEFRKALHHLEGLVVSHIFELAQINIAGTG
ncbi:hypothetical protein L218DRAFT_813115, partial [Marasmius fiardii PR-910]